MTTHLCQHSGDGEEGQEGQETQGQEDEEEDDGTATYSASPSAHVQDDAANGTADASAAAG